MQMDSRVFRIYKLTKKLGSGAFGEIFQCINTKTNEEYAIKLEPANTSHPQLFYEAKVYQYLLNDASSIAQAIPQVYYCSSEGNYNFLVMDLLGSSLEDLFNLCGRKFSLKTVLMIADQALNRLEFIHSRSILHRDVKPDNFLMGTGKKSHRLYIMDFGLAKRYIGKDGKHIQFRDDKNLTGTARYASIYTHLGYEQGRRDDLESLGYVLLYFLRGSLPWQNLKAYNKRDKYEKIKEKKLATPVEVLCKGFPQEFATYINYCKGLKFEEKPDYKMLRNMLNELFASQKFEKDHIFDWTPLLEKKKQEEQMAAQAAAANNGGAMAPEPQGIDLNGGIGGNVSTLPNAGDSTIKAASKGQVNGQILKVGTTDGKKEEEKINLEQDLIRTGPKAVRIPEGPVENVGSAGHHPVKMTAGQLSNGLRMNGGSDVVAQSKMHFKQKASTAPVRLWREFF